MDDYDARQMMDLLRKVLKAVEAVDRRCKELERLIRSTRNVVRSK